jgi:hypothetical protein
MLIPLRGALLNPNDRKRSERAKAMERRLGGRLARNIDHFRKATFRFGRAPQLSWKSADPPRTLSSAGTYPYRTVPMAGTPETPQPTLYGPAISDTAQPSPHYGTLSTYFNHGR